MVDTPTHAVMTPLLTGDLFRPELYNFSSTLDSTNRRAALLAQEGALEGTVVVADQQTQGRGRLGRTWSSPAGLNLYFSVVLRPVIPPSAAAQLTLLASLALAQTVVHAGAESVEIKWPNDLLLDGRKLAGILTEMRTDSYRIQYVIVGIGVNIHGNGDVFPVELRDKAITLAGFLRHKTTKADRIERPWFLANALAQMAYWYARFQQEGFAALRQDWLDFSQICGRQVHVNLASVPSLVGTVGSWRKSPDSFVGQALSLDADGFLLVQRADSTVTRVLAGDVTILSGDQEIMLLVVDIGNTNIVLGVYQGSKLLRHWRIATRVEQTGDEYGILVANLFQLAGISLDRVKFAIIASVVLPIQSALVRMFKRDLGILPLLVGPGIKTGMPIRCDNPREVGADRIVNAVAAFEQVKQAVVVVDFGTAITFDLVSDKGEYLGGAIAPGLGLATNALYEKTAQLPSIDLARPRTVIGRNTVAAMQSGLYWGYVGLVDGLIVRMIEESTFDSVRVIATGGLARLIAGESERIELVDEYLTLTGLQLLYERNC